MKAALFFLLSTFVFAGVSSGVTVFGLRQSETEYASYCDKGKSAALNPLPRACFVAPWHIAGNLHDPRPENLAGMIDASGKRFVLFPNARVTLKNLEIHVDRFDADDVENKQYMNCVKVLAYRLPEREIQIREVWCPGRFIPIIL